MDPLLRDESFRSECPQLHSRAGNQTFRSDCVDLVNDEHVLSGRRCDLASDRGGVWPVRFAAWCRSGSEDRLP
jgi:hypothetical protein